jgi:FixJ family two-component response regulator/PAS domain-containing protein
MIDSPIPSSDITGSDIRDNANATLLLDRFDWAAAGLDPPSAWDPALVQALRLILPASFPMFICWGPELRLFHNSAFEPVIAGKPGSFGRPMAEVFAEAWTEIESLLTTAREGQTIFREDFHVPLRRDGRVTSTWWSFSYSPIPNADGDPGGVYGIGYETTRRLLTDQALRASEASLKAMADATPGLLWKCASDGRLIWVNQALGDYLSPDAADTVWDDHVHSEDIAPAQAVYAESIASGRLFEAQQRLRGRDGSYRWFAVQAQQVVGPHGRLEWFGAATDIDDWRTAADALVGSDQLMRDFHGADTTLVWTADIASRRLAPVNRQSRRAWSLPDLEDMTWDDWAREIHADDRVAFLTLFDRVAADGASQIRFRHVSDLGAARWFQLTAFPIGADRQRIGGLVIELGMETDPRIYLVDENEGRRRTLASMLSRRGFRVRAFDSYSQFGRVCTDLSSGCVVLRVSRDLTPALNVAAALKGADQLAWIASGDFDDRVQDVVILMKLGALDVLLSPSAEAVAVAAQAAFDLARPEKTTVAAQGRDRLANLSAREQDVLRGLIAGGTNKTIALDLGLSPRTVETHRAHLMDRLGVTNLAELVRLATEASF